MAVALGSLRRLALPALQCCAIAWICAGLALKVATTESYGALTIAIIALNLCALAISLWFFDSPRWRFSIATLLATFAAIHVLVLLGLLQDCNCFGAVHLNIGVMLAVNAALALGIAAAPSPPGSVTAAWKYRGISMATAAALSGSLLYVRPPFLFPVRLGSVSITEGSRLSDYANVDVLASLASIQARERVPFNVYLYDPSCQKCAEAKRIVVKIAQYDLYTDATRWYFVNVGSGTKSEPAEFARLGICMQVAEKRVAVPVLLSVRPDGFISEIRRF